MSKTVKTAALTYMVLVRPMLQRSISSSFLRRIARNKRPSAYTGCKVRSFETRPCVIKSIKEMSDQTASNRIDVLYLPKRLIPWTAKPRLGPLPNGSASVRSGHHNQRTGRRPLHPCPPQTTYTMHACTLVAFHHREVGLVEVGRLGRRQSHHTVGCSVWDSYPCVLG